MGQICRWYTIRSYGGIVMTVAEYTRLTAQIAVLKEIAREYPTNTIDDIIVQLEARRNDFSKAYKATKT